MRQKEFEERFLSQWRVMYELASRMLDASEAEDAVQDLFERFLNNLDDLDGVESPKAFCLTATRRICIDRLRNRARHPSVSLDAVADPPADSADRLESLQQQSHILNVIETLPAGQQTVMKLRAFAGMDNAEIARETGFTNETVRQQLSRARRTLRNLLK